MADTPNWSEIVAAEVEPILLGEPVLTWDELVAAVGESDAHVRKLWHALGFGAPPHADERWFADSDVAALQTITQLSREGVIDPGLQVAIARSLGQTMARLAEWQVDFVGSHIRKELSAGDITEDRVRKTVRREVEESVPALQAVQAFAWRRHLAATATTPALRDAGDGRVLAVGFADMVGYTRLTRHLAADELTELLDSFESSTAEAITTGGGWLIKTVGDEVMFAADDPVAAARIGLALQALPESVPSGTAAGGAGGVGMPQLRVGLAYGPVLARFGDLYGSVVNTAARLTGVARPTTVLIDAELAHALEDHPEFTTKSLRPVRVRGIDRLRSYVLRER